MINCFKCNKKMESLFEDELHPSKGIHFFSYGHYGTTVFDPMDGSTLNIVICDDCLTIYKENTIIK